MAPSYSADRDLPGARHSFATAQLALRSLRLTIALKRFNPSQARLPAGSSGGRRWTGSGSGGGAAIQPVSYRPRSRSGGTRVIRGQVYEVTPGQEARLDVSAAQARAAIREVQRHDPTWRPRPSIYEGVEGEILANQSDTLQAGARLRELGARETLSPAQQDILLPNGRLIGRLEGRSLITTRTVTTPNFNKMLEELSPGAKIVSSPPAYGGVWYRRPDGSIFGVRRSEEHGITFDVIENDHPLIRSGFKVHQK